MITQDARERCQGVWSAQPPAGRPEGRQEGPQNQTHAKTYLPPPPAPQLLGREINTLRLSCSQLHGRGAGR